MNESKTAMLKYNVDALGKWFETVESFNEDMTVYFGKVDRQTRELHSYPDYSHTKFDGIGGFLELMRREGARDLTPPLLRSKPEPPKGLEWFKMWTYSEPHTPFATEFAPANTNFAMNERGFLAFRAFSKEETKTLLTRARLRQVTLNTLLLSELNEALCQLSGTAPVGYSWMIPVNMRGSVTGPRPTANHTSSIEVVIRAGGNYASLHSQIQNAFERNQHWRSWFRVQWTSYFSASLRRRIMSKERLMKSAVGSLSNLGAWNVPNLSDACDWLFAPPVSARYPLGAGALTINGRLTLTLQVHPIVRESQAIVDRLNSLLSERLDGIILECGRSTDS